jgi:hypothetical protein
MSGHPLFSIRGIAIGCEELFAHAEVRRITGYRQNHLSLGRWEFLLD